MTNNLEPRSPTYRILVLVNVYHPDRGGGASVFTDMARGLSELGHEVTVRCAYPYYPEWEDKWRQNGLNVVRYFEDGVRVERYGIYIPRDPNRLLARVLNEASFFLSLLRGSIKDGTRSDFDIVISFCPLLATVACGWVSSQLMSCPQLLIVQDLSADAAESTEISKSKFVQNSFRRLQRWLFNRADSWSTISPLMADRLRSIAARGQPVHYIPNWLSRPLEHQIVSALEKASVEEFKGVPNLLYAGNIGKKQSLLRFCEELCASEVNFRFLIHGAGSQAERIGNWVESKREAGDYRFEFGPFLPEATFAEKLAAADFYVITERQGIGQSFIPSKLIPSLAAGTPVLAVSDQTSPLGHEVLTHDLGPHFEWAQLREVHDFLRDFMSMVHRYESWAGNCLQRSHRYRYENVISDYDSAIRSAISPSQP